MNPAHLLDLAKQIAQLDGGKPRQASLRRAVSTAYYALFHALCWQCATTVVGGAFRSPRFWAIVTPIYPAVDHGTALLGRAFLNLHTARIKADYDPAEAFSRAQALELVAQASTAVETVGSLDREEGLALVGKLLAKSR